MANTAGLERKVLKLMNSLGKRPMAWVNALTTTGAVTAANDTILGTWATVYGMPELVTSKGSVHPSLLWPHVSSNRLFGYNRKTESL